MAEQEFGTKLQTWKIFPWTMNASYWSKSVVWRAMTNITSSQTKNHKELLIKSNLSKHVTGFVYLLSVIYFTDLPNLQTFILCIHIFTTHTKALKFMYYWGVGNDNNKLIRQFHKLLKLYTYTTMEKHSAAGQRKVMISTFGC